MNANCNDKRYVADVCVVSVVSGIAQITRINWISAVAEADELSAILTSVFDDLRRKFTSNIKNEFAVRSLDDCLSSIVTRLQCVVLPELLALSCGPRSTPVQYLKEVLRTPMHRLIGNLMCNNFACLNQGGVKLTVWRLSFDHRAIGALAHVLAQVWIYFDNVADCLKVVAE